MKLEHYETVRLGMERLYDYRRLQDSMKTSVKIFIQPQDHGKATGYNLTIGGQVRMHSSSTPPHEEDMRETWEKADAAVWQALNKGLDEAHAIMMEQIKSLDVVHAPSGKEPV